MGLFSLSLTIFLTSTLAAIINASTSNVSLSSNTTLLNFDSLPTTHGLGSLPSPHHHLLFTSFSVFAPDDPSLRHLISQHDHNCATSAPHALVGSRSSFAPASIAIANASSMAAAGLLPYFSLVAFEVKPMDAPDVGSTVFVKGHSVGGGDPLEWRAEFPAGYHLPFRVEMGKHSREAWERLGRVEMWAAYGEDALDWEFCVDDLEVQFFLAGEGHHQLVHQEVG
ncbi:hypothetical protein MMC11_006215 [Xylographa trunciseda]|nr:hypothetical protein [Xylographa trunciseda]